MNPTAVLFVASRIQPAKSGAVNLYGFIIITIFVIKIQAIIICDSVEPFFIFRSCREQVALPMAKREFWKGAIYNIKLSFRPCWCYVIWTGWSYFIINKQVAIGIITGTNGIFCFGPALGI